MKILILDSYYDNFLKSFYSRHPEVELLDFESHRAFLMAQRFGTSDAYSFNLKKLGCQAQEIVTNDDILQMKWARENDIKALSSYRYLNYGLMKIIRYNWRYKIIEEQVKQIKPDVLYIQEGNILSDAFIAKLKPLVKLVVGQVASPIPKQRTYKSYDIVLTSFPHFVECFRKKEIASEYFPLAFDDRILSEVGAMDFKFDVTFIGGISRAHKQGYELLNDISDQLPIDIFGYGKETLEQSSPIYKRHHGEVWGLDMYGILKQSRIILNRHIDVSENYANNFRLYETTGMGACLVTDLKANLHQLFEPDNEIVTYRSSEELIERVKYLLANESERTRIAEAGQKRTLKEHNFYNRMKDLIEIIKNYTN